MSDSVEKTMQEIKFDEYVENLLGKERKKELISALEQKKAIVITGPKGATGKTALAVILRDRGYTVFESGFNNMHEVHLDKPLKECTHAFAQMVH